MNEDDRGWTEAELRRQSTPNLGEGPKPQIRVMEDDGFGLGLWVLCALLVILMVCVFVVMGR